MSKQNLQKYLKILLLFDIYNKYIFFFANAKFKNWFKRRFEYFIPQKGKKMILWNNPPPPEKLKADQVEVSGEGLISGKTGQKMYFTIKPMNTEEAKQAQFNATHCQVTFEGASKPHIMFKTGPNNEVNCCWTAYLPGSYKIIIKYDNEQINGSPFTCNVTESDNGLQILEKQLAKIVCTGPGLFEGIINKPNEVRVNEVNGMIGGLRVAMEGPGKSTISFRTNPDDESLSMFYQVPNAGDYSLIVKFMDQHVKGSPFKITVKE